MSIDFFCFKSSPCTWIFPSPFFNPERITVYFQTGTPANILEG